MDKEKFTKLSDKLKNKYLKSTNEQMQQVNDIRGEYTIVAKKLLEEYMKKEKAVYKKIII